MPGYQAPQTQLLHGFTSSLHKDYKGTNPDRKNDIAFIEKMSTHSDEALLGACVLKLKKTEYSYDTITSSIYGKFFKSSSTFHELLKKGMLIDDKKNPLDDKQCLIYLNQLAHDLKRNPLPTDVKDSKNAENSLQEIKSVQNELLKRLSPIIENTLKRPPTQRALLKSFSELPENYEKASCKDSSLSSWIGYKEKHEQYAKFIKLIQDMPLNNTSSADKHDHFRLTSDYTIRYGILLHIRNQIAKEYKLRSAKNNSRLHDLCEDALNIQPGTVVPHEIQDIYFSDVRSLIARLKYNAEYLNQFEKAGLKKPKEFLKKMEKDLNEELSVLADPTKNPDSKVSTQLTQAITWTAQFGLSIISGNIAAQLFPKLSENVLKKSIGLVGLIYYGKTAENVFLQVGGELESRILGTVAGVVCTVLDPIGALAGYLAGQAIGVMISAGEKGVRYMMFNPSIMSNDLENSISEQQWLQTLHDTLPENKKKILLKITDNLYVEDLSIQSQNLPVQIPVKSIGNH